MRRLPFVQQLDPHIHEAIIGAGTSLLLRVLGAGLTFGFNILVARMLGVRESGIFFLALTIVAFAAVIGRLGLDNTMLRFTASEVAAGNWEKVVGIQNKGLWLSGGASILVTAVLLASASGIANYIFGEPALARPLQIMAASILPFNLLMLYGELLRALKRIGRYALVQSVGVAGISSVLLLILYNSLTLAGVSVVYVLACGGVAIFAASMWWQAAPQIAGLRGEFRVDTLMRTALPLLSVALLQIIVASTSNVLLGLWHGSEAVAIFTAANRTAVLTSLVLLAINSIAAPKFAALYQQRDHKALGKLARSLAKMSILLASPFLLIFTIMPARVVGLFGIEFVVGAQALTILSVGQSVNVATGSVGFLLIMTGHETLYRDNVLATTILHLLLQVVLVWYYGVIGAAIGSAITMILVNLVSTGLAYWKLSILTLPIPDSILTWRSSK